MPLKSKHSALIVVWRRLTPEKKNVTVPDHDPSGPAARIWPEPPPGPNDKLICTRRLSPGVGTAGQERIDATRTGIPLVILAGLLHGKLAISALAGRLEPPTTSAAVSVRQPIHLLIVTTYTSQLPADGRCPDEGGSR
jgi:hypothetical protein